MGENQRDKFGIILGVSAVVILGLVIISLVNNPPPTRSQPSSSDAPTGDCAAQAEAFQDYGDTWMVTYLGADGRGDDAFKQDLRDRLRGVDEPACVSVAKRALFTWADAVDDDNQAGMTAADERYLRALDK